jgi:hypothetical protein
LIGYSGTKRYLQDLGIIHIHKSQERTLKPRK